MPFRGYLPCIPAHPPLRFLMPNIGYSSFSPNSDLRKRNIPYSM